MEKAERDLLNLNRNRARRTAPCTRPAHARPRRNRSSMFYVQALLWTVFALVLVAYASRPLLHRWIIMRELDLVREQVNVEVQKASELQWQEDFANSSNGRESLVKKYGYLKEGETAFRTPVASQTPEKQAPIRHKALTRWEKMMFGLCHLFKVAPANSETAL